MITGASSDIGLECVKNSLVEGQKVCAVFRKKNDELSKLKEKFKEKQFVFFKEKNAFEEK